MFACLLRISLGARIYRTLARTPKVIQKKSKIIMQYEWEALMVIEAIAKPVEVRWSWWW